LKVLGIDVVVYDPFLSKDSLLKGSSSKTGCHNLVSFEELLGADIITCHTPLTRAGPFPTHHLFGKGQLARLSPNTLLINSGRGAVIDNKALLSELSSRPLSVVLDVWENEPNIDRQLLDKVTLGTPHISGYSLEGKERGTYMVYRALCEYLNLPISEQKQQYLSNDKSTLCLNAESLNDLILACYDIREDDNQFRQDSRFDLLRKNYISRREYSHFTLPANLEKSTLRDAFALIRGEK
jgi:erythronate-4-phosphate dehydrogenase